MPKKIIDQETAAAAIAALVDVLDGEESTTFRPTPACRKSAAKKSTPSTAGF